jgi:hypothetical protein
MGSIFGVVINGAVGWFVSGSGEVTELFGSRVLERSFFIPAQIIILLSNCLDYVSNSHKNVTHFLRLGFHITKGILM